MPFSSLVSHFKLYLMHNNLNQHIILNAVVEFRCQSDGREGTVPHLNFLQFALKLTLSAAQDVNKSPRSNRSLSRYEAFAGQQNMCLLRLRDVRTRLPCPSQNTLERIDILVTNSFICRVNPICPDISGNHPFHSVHRILKRPRSPEAGCVSIVMAMTHNIDILKPARSLDFHKGEIEQIKYTVS